ncbi:unnamed protein product [Trichogramma brassicae]|uniref:Uncharacterized protein n=1 Tax=Trichogramma brassicae TaxID=86971 RepID=A0A6H5IUB0_9HYME|nr:unnamed protein product [Trichogramma brassicae]
MNGLNVDDDVDKLRDRLTRFEIRTRFGDDKAMWDPVQDVASQRPAGSVASNNQAAVEATPLASSPNKLGNNFRQWRNMHNISESSSLMDTVMDGNAERARRVAEEESAESVAESELRGRVDDLVHTEQQRALESSNEGRSESVNREEIVHSSEREEQIAPSEFERGPAAGATSTVRRVAFVNDSNAVNRNKADRATVSGVDGATPAAFVTARSQLYQSEILGAGSNAAQSEPLDLLISGGSSPGRIPEDRGRLVRGVLEENYGRMDRDRLVRGVLEEDCGRIDLKRDIRIERDRGRQRITNRAGDATGSRGSDDVRRNRGLDTGMVTGGCGRRESHEPQGNTCSRTGLRERGDRLTRYENSRYGPNANGWSSVPDGMRGEHRNSMSNSAWNGSVGFNSTLARERNTCDLYRQWGLIFRDSGKNNPELFITRLLTCAGRYQLSLDDICRTLPAVLDMEACAWLEREEKDWITLEDMADAFRLQYCDEGLCGVHARRSAWGSIAASSRIADAATEQTEKECIVRRVQANFSGGDPKEDECNIALRSESGGFIRRDEIKIDTLGKDRAIVRWYETPGHFGEKYHLRFTIVDFSNCKVKTTKLSKNLNQLIKKEHSPWNKGTNWQFSGYLYDDFNKPVYLKGENDFEVVSFDLMDVKKTTVDVEGVASKVDTWLPYPTEPGYEPLISSLSKDKGYLLFEIPPRNWPENHTLTVALIQPNAAEAEVPYTTARPIRPISWLSELRHAKTLSDVLRRSEYRRYRLRTAATAASAAATARRRSFYDFIIYYYSVFLDIFDIVNNCTKYFVMIKIFNLAQSNELDIIHSNSCAPSVKHASDECGC